MPDTPEGLTIAEGGATDAQKSFINDNFRAAMSEEHGTHVSMADYTDLNGVAKSLINGQKMIGNPNTLIPPTEKSTPEEWTEFNRKIGMPAEKADYGLAVDEGSTEADKEWFEEMAHSKLQLSKKQATELWNEMNTRSKTAREDFGTKNKAKLAESDKVLREEWGTNYDAMVKETNKGLERMDEDGQFRKFMKSTGLNQQPEMLRFANKVAQLFTEDKGPGATVSTAVLSKEAAAGQYKKMYSEAMKNGTPDLNHALFNKKDPGHAALVAKASKLADLAQGGN
jgi:hypothetical protein